MDSENTVQRSKKIRIYPTAEQKQTFLRWAGASRHAYNLTIAYYKEHKDEKISRYSIQKDILKQLKEEGIECPFRIKQMAIDDACIALINARKRSKRTHTWNEVGWRKKKDKYDSMYIPKTAIKKNSIYPSILHSQIYFTEEVFKDVQHDCRLIHTDGRFYLAIPYRVPIKKPETQRRNIVSLDPGVRTFLTCYDGNSVIKIGQNDFNKMFRSLYGLDKLISKKTKGNSKRSKYNRAIDLQRYRITNRIDELHKQVAKFLVVNYDTVVIPKLNGHQMASKLHSKVVRKMLTWSHGRFRQILKLKAQEYSCNVVEVNEAYTSKTCGVCGNINDNLGFRKQWTCLNCKTHHDRDINGARNILLRALLDSTTGDLQNV